MHYIVEGISIVLLFLGLYAVFDSLEQLHGKVDEIPGSGAGVATILAQLRADRASVHAELEGVRWQLDPIHQSLDVERRNHLAQEDRLTRLVEQYDKLLTLVEKNTVHSVDSTDGIHT
jgi:uncharacterized protein (DUF3084 family)